MRRTLLRVLFILVASSALGLAVNHWRRDTDNDGQPRRLPLIAPPKPELLPGDVIALDDAKPLWNSAAGFFLDARAPADYMAGHIAGAFNLPIETFEQQYPQIATMVTFDTPLVTYCDGVECELSHRLALRLRELGYKNVHVLVNGWTVWKQANLPTKLGDKP
jgi:rhodanese-related sulfurtransferase